MSRYYNDFNHLKHRNFNGESIKIIFRKKYGRFLKNTN